VNQEYIAFFDLDHTILNDSSGRILGPAAIRHGFIKRRKLIPGTLYALGHKLGFIEGDLILPRMVTWLKDHPVQPVFDFVQHMFDDVLKGTIRKAAIEEIEWHRKNNARLVLLSASINFICQPIIDFLGLDDLICTDLKIENNRFCGTTQGGLCFGEEKLTRTLNYLQNNGSALKDAYFYSDSHTDIPMLEAVGYPVAVSPDRKLAATARERGWKICEW
jgi:HAD superfamily hydrolase (TIGR01490 family)